LMAYQIDLIASAKRHWLDAEMLLKLKRAQCAGYHYGYSAECGLKSVLFRHNIPRREDRRNDPYWAHFPELRTLLIRDGRGRLPQKLYQLLAHASFMQNWDTDIRYATDHAVDEERASLWREQADAILGVIFY
jgi:hypothetical protein